MKKVDLNETIQTIAAVGALVGIVFLAIEIRQNTASLEISAYQDLVSQIAGVSQLVIENPEASLLALGDTPLEDMSPEDRLKATQLMVLVLRHGDMAFYQSERGVIREDRLRSSTNMVRAFVCSPNFSVFWPNARQGFTSEYQEYMQAMILNQCE